MTIQTVPGNESSPGIHWTWLILFGVAFGYLEAAVVIYLRELYAPGGFAFPLALPREGVLWVELGRELATLLMLGGVAGASTRVPWARFGVFCVLFGVWDIVFYVALKVVLGWPPSLMTWDVLFLVPLVWTGPVLTAVLVAVSLVVGGGVIAQRALAGRPPRPPWWAWGLAGLGVGMMLAAFMAHHALVRAGGVPGRFPWLPYGLGLLLGWAGFLGAIRARPGGEIS